MLALFILEFDEDFENLGVFLFYAVVVGGFLGGDLGRVGLLHKFKKNFKLFLIFLIGIYIVYKKNFKLF